VLKDYLMTSRGDLLRVVQRIEQMVSNQHSKYRKDLSTARFTVKFEHNLEALPFLPPGIHDVLTPPAIERIRQQDLLLQRDQKQRGGHPCSGLFEKTNGLPCRHTLRNVRRSGSKLRLNHPYDDHWRYERGQGHSIHLSPRPHQSFQEPLIAQTRGAPRRDEASTRRDPSAFERRVPPSTPQFHPLGQAQGQTLAEALQHAAGSIVMSALTSAPAAYSVPAPAPATVPVTLDVPVTVTVPITVDVPASTPVSSLSSISSSPSTLSNIIVTTPQRLRSGSVPSPVQPRSTPPSLEEFLADIERRRSQNQCPLDSYRGPDQVARALAQMGQENDSADLIEARNIALDTTGQWADYSPTFAWNLLFGDKAVAEREMMDRNAAKAQEWLQESGTKPPKRAAAVAASDAWIGLTSRKRQRRQD
jgi:hypothetical protein